jgi:hypothetical protein
MTLKQRLERLEKAVAAWTGCPACDVRPLLIVESQAEADAAVRECTCGNRKVILLQMADSKGVTPTKV